MRDLRGIYASELHTNIEWIWTMNIYYKVKYHVLLCKYENLIDDPKKMIETVFSFCELQFKEEYAEEVPVIGSNHKVQEKKGFSEHGVDKWLIF